MKKKQSWIEKKFGKPCDKCGKRHSTIATIGQNLPKEVGKECPRV